MWILKKYTKKLEKRYKKDEIGRAQLNFACDAGLIARLKLLARYLETPIYPLTEHLLELGMSDIAATIRDSALTELLQRHLLQEHLLVSKLNPLSMVVSQRAKRINNTFNLLELIEHEAGNPEAVEQIIAQMLKEAS